MRRHGTLPPTVLAGALALLAAGPLALHGGAVALAAVHAVPGSYPTIQAAVDAAAPGDTVQVAAGVYEEQVVIATDLVLLGAGADQTVVQAPLDLPHSAINGQYRAVVCIEQPALAVKVGGLTVDGLGRQPLSGGRFTGILYYRVAASLHDVLVRNLHETPASDDVTGLGILISLGFELDDADVHLRGVEVERFQKSGIIISGSAGEVLVEDVRIDPLDIYSDSVQNGLEFSFVQTATLRNCQVFGVYYDGDPFPEYTAVGILAYHCNVFTFADCLLLDNQAGLYLVHTEADISGTVISAYDGPSTYTHGLVSVGSLTAGPVAGDPILGGRPAAGARASAGFGGPGAGVDPVPAPAPVLVEDMPGGRPQNSYGLRLRDSVLDGKDQPSSRGLALRSETADALDVVVERCDIVSWETGIMPMEGGIGAVYTRLSGCRIAGSALWGVFAASLAPVDARGSWFGHPTGPYHPVTNPTGEGDAVSDQVLYDPWLTGNLAPLPLPQTISLQDQQGTAYADTVSLTYLGGASDRLYGFSAEVSWDPAVVGAVSVERPASGAFADAVLFQVLPGPGSAVIDAALGGAVQGIERGELCIIRFEAVGTPDWTRSPITVVLNNARNRFNQEVTDLALDAGAVDVDLQPPVIGEVVIANESLSHTDEYGKNGDQLSVTATVTDGHPQFGRAAIRAVGAHLWGAPFLYFPPDSWNAGLARWNTRTALLAPADGPCPFRVEARDPAGNYTAWVADTLWADNTPPLPVTGLSATAGHNAVALHWDDAATTDPNFRHTVVRYTPWQDYPLFGDPEPDFPDTTTAGLPAYEGAGITAELVFAADGSERDQLFVSALAVDLAGNASPVAEGSRARVLNYRLADVRSAPPGSPGDGVVDLFDITRLGDSYGLLAADPGFDPECDLATAAQPADGLPAPDAEIGLDDLMVFADRYALDQAGLAVAGGNAGGMAGGPSASPPAPATVPLAWRQTGPGAWSLVLLEPCPQLKGLAIAAPAGAGEAADLRLEAGALLAGQPAPWFLHGAGGGLSAHLAVLGHGAGLVGHGELLRLVSERPVALPEPLAAARGVDLQPLPTTLPAWSGARRVAGGAPASRGPGAGGADGDAGKAGGQDELPTAFAALGPRPNPFNPATSVHFELPSAQPVQLIVLGLDGRHVRTLVDGALPAGRHAARWDGRDHADRPVAAGTYLYRLVAGPWSATGKLALLK